METDRFDRAYRYCCEQHDRQPERTLLRKRVEQTYPILRETAAAGETITYEEVATRVGTDKRFYLSCILDVIGFLEHDAGNPPLSAVVVRAGSETPSEGMTILAEDLGFRSAYPADDQEAADAMIAAVHAYWVTTPTDQ